MYENIIKQIIVFGPTVLFALIVFVRALIGYYSGARRQAIFFIHSTVAFAICLILYFVLVENKYFDKFILDVINKFMGEDGLEELLGVSPSCKTMREVIVQYIPSQMGFADGLELILRDNGAYLLALVNVSYHVILALVLYYVYLLLEGIFYIIYLIAYSERKHRNKKNRQYADGLVEKPYVKYKKYGATIGLFRGVIRGLVVLSFIGTSLYIISGVGKKSRATYKTNNEAYDLGFTIYKELGSYGEHGIYKVLNMCKDKNDVPYYLFAADLVYQGGLKDEERNIDTNIYLREELNAYVEFSTDTFDLLMKYGSDDLMPVILGNKDGNTMDVILQIMANPKFQTEFKLLIDEFDSKTYFINFALSFLDSMCKYIDEVGFMSGLSPDAVDVMSIAFKPGYLSETIEFERELKYSGKDVELGYIKPSSLLTSADARTLVNAVLEIIRINEIYKDDDKYALKVVEELAGYIKKLSIVDSKRSSELNPVFKRLYAFVDSKYLSNITDEENDQYLLRRQRRMNNIIYKDEYYNDINWVEELNLLANSIEDILLIYDDVYVGDRDAYTAILAIFDEKNANHERNMKLYHDLIGRLEYSKLLGLAASSLVVNNAIEKAIGENIIEGYTIPSDIKYASEFDGDNVYHGEVYYFLSGIEYLCSTTKIKESVELLIDSDDLDDDELLDVLIDLFKELSNVEDGISHSDKLLKSDMIRSLLSSYLIENGETVNNYEIYIDDSVKENNLIEFDELSTFFRMTPIILEEVKKDNISFDGSTADVTKILNFVKKDFVKEALESKIIEGSFSRFLCDYFSGINDFIIVPDFLVRQQRWVSTHTYTSEVKKLITALNMAKDVDMNVFFGKSEEDIIRELKKLNSNTTELFLDSSVLYYSISDYLCKNGAKITDDMPLIVPTCSIINSTYNEEIVDSKFVSRIDKDTLRVILNNVDLFEIENDELGNVNVSKILCNILNRDKEINGELLDNNIINATMAFSMWSSNGLINKNFSDKVSIPEEIMPYSNDSEIINYLKNNFTSTNPWKKEAKNLIYGIDYLIDNFNEDYPLESIGENAEQILIDYAKSNKKTIGLIYSSNILASTLTKGIKDRSTTDSFLVDTEVAYKAGSSVYKVEEIEALINVLKDENVNSFDDVQNIVIDENSYIMDSISKSSLICASITKAILDYNSGSSDNKVIILKKDCYDGTRVMTCESATNFLRGIMVMTNEPLSIDYLKNGFNVKNLNIPSLDEDLKIIESSRTLLATITNNIKVNITSGSSSEVIDLFFADDSKYCQKNGGQLYYRLGFNDSEENKPVAIMSASEFNKLVKFNLGEGCLNYEININNYISNKELNIDENCPNLLYNMIVYYYLNNVLSSEEVELLRRAGIVIKTNVIYIDINGAHKEKIDYIPFRSN